MPNRFICDVIEEMRMADKTKNYAYLAGLIEEAQSLANRMEAGLHNRRDYERIFDELCKVKDELKAAKAELKPLKDAKDAIQREIKGLQAQLKTVKHELAKETKGGTVTPKVPCPPKCVCPDC
jgi:predicted  nucleic acid-binding Zn-ribbon protein